MESKNTRGKDESMVKTTVIFYPLVLKYIQKLRSIALDNGIDLSLSAAVNALIIGQVLMTVHGVEEGLKLMWDFIFDEKTIQRINTEEWKERVRAALEDVRK